jgi:DNA-binding XRE family transcriptional regulator
MNTNCTAHRAISRVAGGLAEARDELGLSRRRLAELSGVSRSSITKLENGGRIEPRLVIQLAVVVCVLDLLSRLTLEDELAVVVTAHARKEEAHV